MELNNLLLKNVGLATHVVAKKCEWSGCFRPALATGYCNVHNAGLTLLLRGTKNCGITGHKCDQGCDHNSCAYETYAVFGETDVVICPNSSIPYGKCTLNCDSADKCKKTAATAVACPQGGDCLNPAGCFSNGAGCVRPSSNLMSRVHKLLASTCDGDNCTNAAVYSHPSGGSYCETCAPLVADTLFIKEVLLLIIADYCDEHGSYDTLWCPKCNLAQKPAEKILELVKA